MPPDRQHAARDLQDLQARAIRAFGLPPRLVGRGIVTSVHGRALASIWVLLSELARLEVDLPVEVWHRPGEIDETDLALLRALPLRLALREMVDDVSGFAIKPVAVWRSAFREVLWIDADNAPLRDPTFLFDDPEFVGKGSLFWRDTSGADRASTWHPGAPVWAAFGVLANTAEEFETGQFLVDKVRCWPEVCLTASYAFGSAFYYRFLLGDKDTFRLAWQRVAQERGRPAPGGWYHADPAIVPYGFMPYGPFHVGRPNPWGAWGGGSVLLGRDRDGRPLFHHRNTEKFTLDRDNPFNADAPNEALYHGHVAALRRRRHPERLDATLPDRPSAPAWTAQPDVPCAWGDLFDRLSILDLKCERIAEPAALAHVRRERDALAEAVGDRTRFPAALGPLLGDLAAVNKALWGIEDEVRAHERAGDFGARFVAVARSVYAENDRRAALKRRINLLLGSALVEEKHFTDAPTAVG